MIKDPINKHAMRLADKQRKAALKNAFKIIDQFAIPSLNPNEMDKYDDVKKVLLERYR